jgi:hypothetical protein
MSTGNQAAGIVALLPVSDDLGATAATLAFSIGGTLDPFPCPLGCAVPFGGSGSAVGTSHGRAAGTAYDATFTSTGTVSGTATYTEPATPFCPAVGSAIGTARLIGSADGMVRRSATPGVTGTVTGVTVDLNLSYQRVGPVAAIQLTAGTVTVSFVFPDSGAGSFTADVAGAGLGLFVVDPESAVARCTAPGPLPFQVVGNAVLAAL